MVIIYNYLECDKLGGAPNCFSGFCEVHGECIDCPSALVDRNKNGKFDLEICSRNGICKLGWKYPHTKGGNGYCVCHNNFKGLACNEY